MFNCCFYYSDILRKLDLNIQISSKKQLFDNNYHILVTILAYVSCFLGGIEYDYKSRTHLNSFGIHAILQQLLPLQDPSPLPDNSACIDRHLNHSTLRDIFFYEMDLYILYASRPKLSIARLTSFVFRDIKLLTP